MVEFFSFRKYTIVIHVDRLDFDCGPALFRATATIETPERRPIDRLIGKMEESEAEARSAVLIRAQCEVESFTAPQC
jgi:hypothetical protein